MAKGSHITPVRLSAEELAKIDKLVRLNPHRWSSRSDFIRSLVRAVASGVQLTAEEQPHHVK